MIVLPDYKLVYVKWVDAYGCSPSWQEIKGIPPVPHYCYSVGWIVAESEHVIVAAPHYSPANEEIGAEEQCSGDMAIPKIAIQCMIDLKKLGNSNDHGT